MRCPAPWCRADMVRSTSEQTPNVWSCPECAYALELKDPAVDPTPTTLTQPGASGAPREPRERGTCACGKVCRGERCCACARIQRNELRRQRRAEQSGPQRSLEPGTPAYEAWCRNLSLAARNRFSVCACGARCKGERCKRCARKAVAA